MPARPVLMTDSTIQFESAGEARCFRRLTRLEVAQLEAQHGLNYLPPFDDWLRSGGGTSVLQAASIDDEPLLGWAQGAHWLYAGMLICESVAPGSTQQELADAR